MEVMLALLFVYIAYRIIRGGFERPQSQKLNAFGIVGCLVLVLLAVSLAGSLFD